MGATRASGPYRRLDVIAVPADIPEAGIRAGDSGAVVEVLGAVLVVDVVEPETGRTLDVLHVEPGPPLHVVERWRIEADEGR